MVSVAPTVEFLYSFILFFFLWENNLSLKKNVVVVKGSAVLVT